MKFLIFPKSLLPILFAAFFVSACGDKEGSGIRPSTMNWRGTELPVTYAASAMEDYSGGNQYPNEYFALHTNDYVLTLKVPQQYIDNSSHKWTEIRSFAVRFKSKIPFRFNFEMDKSSVSPNPRVVGGNFKVLPKSNGKYLIEGQINIHHYENGPSSPTIEALKIYFDGATVYDPALIEWVDPDIDLSL